MKQFDYGKVKEQLKEALDKKRYDHSIRTMRTCIELSKALGCDVEKAKIAGLLHDCAKGLEEKYLLMGYGLSDIISTDLIDSYKALVHSPLGAQVAQREYGVEEEDILNAITYHTTGREGMTLLEKIVFVADAIEPGRMYEDIDKIREIAFVDLDKAVIEVMNANIRHCLQTKRLVHPLTVISRNHYIKKERFKGETI
ncbi:MAG: bis(5'-nucleosyl)-tetraphosphatase (symmetrical) YqeK [Tissierellia bacterium]|nr:bis(5'-nucleosyl)-tetraphosphatase (symmetrical) YqeK [Tissierellia bacterium]